MFLPGPILTESPPGAAVPGVTRSARCVRASSRRLGAAPGFQGIVTLQAAVFPDSKPSAKR